MRFQKIFGWVSLVTISVVSGYFIGSGIVNSVTNVKAQSGKKVIKLADTVNAQLKFTEPKLRQQERSFGENFDAHPNWIKDLSFKLENISEKPIVFLQININFPETRLTGNLMSYTMTFGQRPNSKFKQLNKQMELMPGEVLEVSLDKERDKIHQFINERQPMESIEKVELEIGFIIFEDRTAWTAGTFLRQDPGNPDRYNPIGNL